jgi:quercetin dioxygenase-like cupin family protein
MSTQDVFSRAAEAEWVDLGGGNRRRVLLHTDDLMLVEFTFEKGSVGALHSHPHRQVSYVVAGSFEVTIGERTEVLSVGDGYLVPANVVHGVKALEAGRLVDSFTPARADFLD